MHDQLVRPGVPYVRGVPDQEPTRLPRDLPERAEVGFGYRDVGDSPGARIIRDDARNVAKCVRDGGTRRAPVADRGRS